MFSVCGPFSTPDGRVQCTELGDWSNSPLCEEKYKEWMKTVCHKSSHQQPWLVYPFPECVWERIHTYPFQPEMEETTVRYANLHKKPCTLLWLKDTKRSCLIKAHLGYIYLKPDWCD